MKLYFVPEEHKKAMLSVLAKIDGNKRSGAVFFVSQEEMDALQSSHVIDVPVGDECHGQ